MDILFAKIFQRVLINPVVVCVDTVEGIQYLLNGILFIIIFIWQAENLCRKRC